MPRRRAANPDLPPLPVREKRIQQVKIRLTDTELQQLIRLRPDLAPSAIVALLVDDVLAGRYRPRWATPADEVGKPSA